MGEIRAGRTFVETIAMAEGEVRGLLVWQPHGVPSEYRRVAYRLGGSADEGGSERVGGRRGRFALGGGTSGVPETFPGAARVVPGSGRRELKGEFETGFKNPLLLFREP